MTKIKPKTQTSENTETVKPLKYSFIARLSSHANRFHLLIPKDLVEFYELEAGDKLLVEINSAKLSRPAPETSD